MYCLEAAIAGEPVLRELTGALHRASVLPLGQHVWLLSLTEELVEEAVGLGRHRSTEC
jgi:hypothetical protein